MEFSQAVFFRGEGPTTTQCTSAVAFMMTYNPPNYVELLAEFRLLLGPGIEIIFSRLPGEGRRQNHEDLSTLQLG